MSYNQADRGLRWRRERSDIVILPEVHDKGAEVVSLTRRDLMLMLLAADPSAEINALGPLDDTDGR